MPPGKTMRETAARLEDEIADMALRIAADLRLTIGARQALVARHARFTDILARLRAVLLRFERSARGNGAPTNTRDQQYFRRLRRRVLMLERIAEALALTVLAEPSLLYPDWLPRKHAAMVQIDLLDTAMIWLHRLVIPPQQSEAAVALGCYPDIPLGSVSFMSHAHVAYRAALAQKRTRPLRFLDVGCGGGIKVLLAAGLFDEAVGFDYDAAYVDAAQASFARMGAQRCQAFRGNGLEFEDYAGFDVIYLFKPMSDPGALARLEARIVDDARPGTIVIAPYQEFFLRHEGHNCHRLQGAVYITAQSEAAVRELHAEACRMGPDVRSPDCGVHQAHPQWLRALFMACAENGHMPPV